jgi:hypothetical protein
MDDWKLPWAGGCRCGRVRLEVTLPPLLASACHCAGCQRMSASAFSLSLAVPAAGFRVTAGEPAIGGMHGATRHYFCPHCMSWMFTRPEGMDEIVNLRPSMLDEHRWFVPFVEVYRAEGLAWAKTPAVHSFETLPAPDAWAGFIEEYARTAARPG